MTNKESKVHHDFFTFTHEMARVLSYLEEDANTVKWATFFSDVNRLSADKALIKSMENAFSLIFMPVDLKAITPDNHAYLVRTGSGWYFAENVNDVDKNSAKVYRVGKKNSLLHPIITSLSDIFLIKENDTLLKLFGVSFFINMFALTIPLYFNAIYGRIIPSVAESSLWTLSFIAFLCFLCELLLKKKKSLYCFQLMTDFKNKVQPALFESVIGTSNRADNHWGLDKSKMMQDIRELNSLMWGLISTNFFDVFFVFLFLFVIFIMSGSLVIVPLSIFILQLLIGFNQSRYDDKNKPPHVSPWGPATLDNNYINGTTENLTANFFTQTESYHEFHKVSFFNKQRIIDFLYFLTSIQNILITILAFYLIQKNDISIASLFAVIILSSRISQSATGFIHAIPLIKKLRGKIKSVRYFLERECPLQSTHYHTEILSDHAWSLNDMSFSYDPNKTLFNHINLKIKSGEKVAFIGPPGSGKTTLAKILTGLVSSDKGLVSLKNGEGHPVPLSLATDSTHYIPQLPYLYGETLIAHLCSEKEYSEEQCQLVLSQPFMHWLPPLLNNGLYTTFHSLPFELSAAQKQMLLISRFLLTDNNLWVLDEPTSYVNGHVEQFFVHSAREKMTDKTTLLLFTDNINLFDLVDRVVAFNDGGIVFDGSKSTFIGKHVKAKASGV